LPNTAPSERPDSGGAIADADPSGDAPPVTDTADAAVVVTPDATPPAPDAQTIVVLHLSERADATTQNVTTDATIDGVTQTTNFGAGASLAVDTGLQRRAVLRFDLSSVPAGALVLDASLRLYVESPQPDGTLELAALQQSWNEPEVTWRNRTTSLLWSTQGAPVGAALVSFAATAAGAQTIVLPVATVQAWVDAPANNFGLRILSKSPTNKGALLSASEATLATRRPELVLTVDLQP